MRKLITLALIGAALFVCSAPLVAQDFRRRERIIRPFELRGDSVWYRVIRSDETPSTNGRTYWMSLARFLVEYESISGTAPPPDTTAPTPEPVDTVAPVPADSTYPHRPAGMTLIARNDGSVKESGGHAFGFPDFSAWYDHNVASDIAVVPDPSNASGHSLRFTYPSNDSKAGSANAGRFTGGPYREVYVLVRIFHESGFSDFGNKFFYLGAQVGQRLNTSSPTQFYVDRNGARLRIVIQNGASVVAVHLDDAITLGRWQTLEFVFVAESSPGAGDGRARMYVDGRQVASDAVGWNASAFDGMEWYAEVNRIPTTSFYRLGELYIAGRK